MWDLEKSRREQRALEESLAPRCRADFIAAAGLFPERFLEVATHGLPELEFAQVKYEDPGADFFTVEYRGAGYQQIHTINFNTRSVDAGTIQNNRNDRSTGRQMLALTAVSGLYFGFNTLDVTASLEMGGYVWARAGALMTAKDKHKMSRAIRRRLAFIQDRLDPATYATAVGLSGFTKSDALETLAHMDQKLPRIGGVWDTMIRQEKGRWLDPMLHFSNYRNKGFIHGDTMTVGQFLLCGLEYKAYIRLNRRGQMDKIERYTGVPIRALAADMRARHPRAGQP